MSTLYVLEPGARLEKEYSRLLVVKNDEILLRVPLSRVSQVILVGHTGATTPALQTLLQQEIPLLLVNRSGKLMGRLLPPTHGNLPLRQQQYRRNDDPVFCLNLAQAIVESKIHNQRTLALRLARRHAHIDSAILPQLKEAMQQTRQAESLDTLLGIEGQSARLYFQLYRQAFAEEWQFNRRNRRPPQDPVNALLGLGYTFLSYAMITALEAVGLDPFLGYFHAEKYNRPALALDLMEEFRAPLVDSLTLSLLNRRQLQPDDFQRDPETGGVTLSDRGLRLFIHRFSARLEDQIYHRQLKRNLSYRKLFEVQARRMARFIMGQDEAYRPFRAR